MPTALIADDEEAPRAQLLMALRGAWPGLRVVQECANGVDAWDAFLEHEPAVCFLDVRMPGLTGIEVAQRIGARAQVVFVTAHGDHALAAFDAGAVDYVLKPAPLEVIQAGIGKEVRLVRVADVVYFESDSRYTRVVYSEAGVDAEVLIRTPLKELIAQLDATRFWQIHRAVIVNQRCIASAVRIDEGNMVLTLRGRSEKLPVSRHFQGLFRGQ